MTTIIGVFNDQREAESTLNKLVRRGVDEAALGVIWREHTVMRPEEEKTTTYVDHFDGPRPEAKKGALGGAIGGTASVGGLLLASAGGIFIPEMGFFATAGTLSALAAVAAGAAGGSLTGTVMGALLGATDHDATKVTTTETTYVEVLEKNGFVVSIDSDDHVAAAAALEATGASDISVLDQDGRRRIGTEDT